MNKKYVSIGPAINKSLRPESINDLPFFINQGGDYYIVLTKLFNEKDIVIASFNNGKMLKSFGNLGELYDFLDQGYPGWRIVKANVVFDEVI